MFCVKCGKEVRDEDVICVSCGTHTFFPNSSPKIPKSRSWWRYDDEYITGWQYMGRSLVGALLVII